MPFKFNPFSGNFDQTGSGGGGGASYIDGEVQNFSALPETLGSPAVDSAYLVREAEGAWLLNRKPAGIYIRTANTGTRASDWTYAGEFPDVFSDANFVLYDNGDSTKNLQFQLSGIDTATTRTLTAPNASGTIARTEDFAAPPAIGNTTPNSGAFTTLSANNGTLTASAPALTIGQTWNNSGVTFSALDINVTNTASLQDSALIKATIGGTTVFQFRRDYRLLLSPSGSDALIQAGGVDWIVGRYNGTTSIAAPTIRFNTGNSTILEVGTADTMEMRRTTNPQTFRIYGTYTDASNYERGFVRWSAAGGNFEIGTEGLGTGSGRHMVLRAGSNTFTFFNNGEFSSPVSLRITGRMVINSSATGVVAIRNDTGTDFNRLQFGGTTSSFPALKRSTTTIQVRLADDSGDAGLSCSTLTLSDNLTLGSGDNIVLSTTTGTQIGTATNQLLGFYGATPVDRPNDVVMSWASDGSMGDVNDAQDLEARAAVFEIRARLRELGLMATT